MSDRVVLFAHNPTPSPGAAAFAADTSGDWNTGQAYSVQVVAWLTASEANPYEAGALNYGLDAAVEAFYYEPLTAWQNKTPAAATDHLQVTWSAPTGLTPHHYSVYLQLGAIYDIRNFGLKCNAADISPGTASLTINTVPTLGTTADARIVTLNGTNRTITIDGNKLAYFGVGATAIGDPTGANLTLTVASALLVYNARGVMTQITFGQTLTGISPGEILRYYTDQGAFERYDQDGTAWGARENIQFDLWKKPVAVAHRELVVPTCDGYLAPASYADAKVITGFEYQLNATSLSYANWQTIMQWMRAKTLLWMIRVNDTYTSTSYGPHAQFLVKILGTNYPDGATGTARSPFVLRFAVEREQSQGQYLDWNL